MTTYTVNQSVNFGKANTGLAGTVGYQLWGYGGSSQGARTTTGISESPTGSGIYTAQITFTVGTDSLLVWDTGGGTPVYASNDVPAYTNTLQQTQLDASNFIKANAETVSDKTGYSLTQTFPTNFSALSITGGGAVTVGTNNDKTSYSLSSSGVDSITVESGLNVRQALSLMAAALSGELSGAGTTTITIKAANNNTTTRITATVDASGDRTAITLNPPA